MTTAITRNRSSVCQLKGQSVKAPTLKADLNFATDVLLCKCWFLLFQNQDPRYCKWTNHRKDEASILEGLTGKHFPGEMQFCKIVIWSDEYNSWADSNCFSVGIKKRLIMGHADSSNVKIKISQKWVFARTHRYNPVLWTWLEILLIPKSRHQF